MYLENQTRGTGLDARAAARTVETLLAQIGEPGTSVSLTFVRDAAMRALNRAHRGKDAPTDVLSFPFHPPEAFDRRGATKPLATLRQAQGDMKTGHGDMKTSHGDTKTGHGDMKTRQGDRRSRGDGGGLPERMLGDIVISVDTARRQAADYDAPLEREVQRLLIHAVLHLAGHDHLEPGERAVMEAEERRLADSIGMPWPYLEAAPG